MQIVQPGTAPLSEADAATLALIRDKFDDQEDKFEELAPMDALAARLSVDAVPMRRKQGVFYPRKITMATLGAWRISPPPALVVRFDNNGAKTTFPTEL